MKQEVRDTFNKIYEHSMEISRLLLSLPTEELTNIQGSYYADAKVLNTLFKNAIMRIGKAQKRIDEGKSEEEEE
jgi:hypothetical protein